MSSSASSKPASSVLLLGKKQSVKEGLVSKMASKFQQQAEDSSNSAMTSSTTSVSAASSRKSSSVDMISHPTSLRKSSSDVSSSVDSKLIKSPVHVTRTESHHARFNNARAMFEKMGSAEELDEKPSSSVNNRASSVGRPVSRSSDEENNINNVNNNASYKNSSAYFRSRSTSPYGHQSESGNNGINPATERQSRKTSTASSNGGISTSSSYHNGLNDNNASSTMGLVKSRRLSFQQKQQQNEAEQPLKSTPRNSFPANNFTKTENVDSARRTSVKKDNVPSLVSSPSTGSSNLDMPGDRRPLSAKNSNSTDGIEDYLKNWKKSSPPTSPVNENEEKK